MMEVLKRLDCIIELLEKMTDNETKAIKKELAELHDWKVSFQSIKNSKSDFLQLLWRFGPWLFALGAIIIEFKVLKG